MKKRIGDRSVKGLPLQRNIIDSPSGKKIKRPNPERKINGVSEAVYVDTRLGPMKNRMKQGYCYVSAVKNFEWAVKEWPDSKSVNIQIGSFGIMGSDVLHWINGLPTHKKWEDFLPIDPFTGSPYMDCHVWVEVRTKNDEKILIDPTYRNFKEYAKNRTIMLNCSIHSSDVRHGMKESWYQPVYIPAKRSTQAKIASMLYKRSSEIELLSYTSKETKESIESKKRLDRYYQVYRISGAEGGKPEIKLRWMDKK